jgi:hypothetical protein
MYGCGTVFCVSLGFHAVDDNPSLPPDLVCYTDPYERAVYSLYKPPSLSFDLFFTILLRSMDGLEPSNLYLYVSRVLQRIPVFWG